MTILFSGRESLHDLFGAGPWPRQKQTVYADLVARQPAKAHYAPARDTRHCITCQRTLTGSEQAQGYARCVACRCPKTHGNVRMYCRTCCRTKWGLPPKGSQRFRCTQCRERET